MSNTVTKSITSKGLAEALYNVKVKTMEGADRSPRPPFATIEMKTTPKVLVKDRDTKEPNPFGQITKVATYKVQFGCNYSNCVNNQRVREEVTPDFIPQAHKWATHVGGALMRHNTSGELVFAIKIIETVATKYYAQDGSEISYDDCGGFLPVPKSGSASQGTDKAVIWVTPKLTSLVSVSLDGATYKVASPTKVTYNEVASIVGQPEDATA